MDSGIDDSFFGDAGDSGDTLVLPLVPSIDPLKEIYIAYDRDGRRSLVTTGEFDLTALAPGWATERTQAISVRDFVNYLNQRGGSYVYDDGRLAALADGTDTGELGVPNRDGADDAAGGADRPAEPGGSGVADAGGPNGTTGSGNGGSELSWLDRPLQGDGSWTGPGGGARTDPGDGGAAVTGPGRHRQDRANGRSLPVAGASGYYATAQRAARIRSHRHCAGCTEHRLSRYGWWGVVLRAVAGWLIGWWAIFIGSLAGVTLLQQIGFLAYSGMLCSGILAVTLIRPAVRLGRG